MAILKLKIYIDPRVICNYVIQVCFLRRFGQTKIAALSALKGYILVQKNRIVIQIVP